MSKHTSNLSECDLSSTKSRLKQMAQDIQSLTLRQIQHENQIIKEKKERDSHLAILEEELKLVKERDGYIRKQKKNPIHLALGLANLMLRKRVLESMLIINLHLEELKEKSTLLRLGLTYLISMVRKMLKYI